MKKRFKDIKPSKESMERIEQANDIIDEYLKHGLKLTLRQLYYQFVTRGLIPNTDRSYKNLGTVISNGRLAGLIDWDVIEDRLRQPEMPPQFVDLEHLVDTAIKAYRLPRRMGQETYVELWVEKDALAGVLLPLARKWHITLMVNRGYSSSSAMHESAGRIRNEMSYNESEESLVLYLGDLDPSGEDMVRDIRERLSLFGSDTEVSKLGLTMEQVDKFEPPPNPAKLSDTRAKDFIAKYGTESWEVDALPPTVLRDLIDEAMVAFTDQPKVDEVLEQEKADKKKLRSILKESSDE